MKSFAETLVLVPLDVTEQAIVTEADVRHAPEIFTDAFATFRGAYWVPVKALRYTTPTLWHI